MWGIGAIDGHPVAIGLFDFRFMGGSMGSVVGEKIARCFEAALTERIPAIVVSRLGRRTHAGGHAVAAAAGQDDGAAGRLDTAGVPFISVLTDPTTGGVLASFASLGDVIVAEPQALDRLRGRAGRQRHGRRGAAGGLPERRVPARRTASSTWWCRVRSCAPPWPPPAPAAAVPAAEEAWAHGEQRGWGPIGVLSGLAERLGGAVSETIGIDVEPQPGADDERRRAAASAVAKHEAEDRQP